MLLKGIRLAPLLIIVSVIVSCSGASNGNLVWSPVTPPAAGTLDTGFGTMGKVTTSFGTSVQAGAYAAVLQSDGKNIAAGYATSGTGTVFAMARYNVDGTLDSSFSSTGTVTTAFGSIDDRILSVVIQTDGKIIAAGYSNTGTANVFALARYNPDGSLDSAFGTGGKVTTSLGSVDDTAQTVAIQSDGKIIAAGYSNNGTCDVFALARYNSDGTLDTNFGTEGKATNAVGTFRNRIETIALQTDGKIVAAGHSDSTFTVARYNSDGSLDTGFGIAGIMKTVIGKYSYGYSCKIQSNGKIVVAGWSVTDGTFQNVFALVRYNGDGSLDSSFGNSGVAITALGASDTQAFDLAIQQDGKIVTAGWSIPGGSTPPYLFALARYNADGTLDTSFGSQGVVTTTFSSWTDYACSVAIQSDGKILATGLSRPDSTSSFFAVARYLP